jgi:hypothetical protein
LALVGSGLLYGGIGVLWLVVLGQRWLHRRTLVRAERSAPASSRQRIIEPRSDRRARSASVVAMTAVSERGSAQGAAVFEGIAAADRRSRAVRRRRRILLSLLVITAVTTVLGMLAGVPWWVPAAAAGATLCWFVSGVSVARAGRRARRGHRRRMRNRELARGMPDPAGSGPARPPVGVDRPTRSAPSGDTDSSWDSVPAVEVVARWGRENSDTDGLDRRQLTAIVPPGPARVTAVDPASWQPVPVPLPTYVTAPRVPRTVARIDFAIAGSWTSAVAASPGVGRGPRVEVEVEEEDEPTAEVPYELPRAVGD